MLLKNQSGGHAPHSKFVQDVYPGRMGSTNPKDTILDGRSLVASGEKSQI
ncbi:hypothetical protein FRUB_09373 [Fimbriiglobus ruber]|uniref:Uncharacterized protein n=1 Tax=Fimbriiglobus ruber TaxID=1908690 RepID=A0A225D5F4_9BACT|nr:hypothetical protein FRUB_09373 [Fimbriiglobus ruber]